MHVRAQEGIKSVVKHCSQECQYVAASSRNVVAKTLLDTDRQVVLSCCLLCVGQLQHLQVPAYS